MELLNAFILTPLEEIAGSITGPGLIALFILLSMSLFCWYLILSRLCSYLFRIFSIRKFYLDFSQHGNHQYLSALIKDNKPQRNRYPQLCVCAWQCWLVLSQKHEMTDDARYSLLLNVLQDELDSERIRLESGLTLLASIGACAPFVGLFGTVWGIYHALQAIGAQGSSSLEQVAGPVGEALVMTGIGLLVALPAVFAYNLFVRLNRRELAQLDRFANQLSIVIRHNVLLPLTQTTALSSVTEFNASHKQGELL
jgi:Biopolymer transport proteins